MYNGTLPLHVPPFSIQCMHYKDKISKLKLASNIGLYIIYHKTCLLKGEKCSLFSVTVFALIVSSFQIILYHGPLGKTHNYTLLSVPNSAYLELYIAVLFLFLCKI